MNTFKGILELDMFLMSKHLNGYAVHHAPALLKDSFFIANTAVKVRLTYARD